MKYENILDSIGNTPLVKINKLFPEANKKGIDIFIKLEKQNPGGSIKDRIANRMIEDAEKNGLINKETIIIEPTSGNTGIGLALICAVKSYKLILTMPESMSIERRRLLSLYGAELVLTPREQGMKGAIAKAKELQEKFKNSWIPMQFENQSNVSVHEETTAKEIFNDLGGKSPDYIITGVGTGGHITGCANFFKEKNKSTLIYAVEPFDSPVLSGGNPGPHPLQGLGAGFIPTILNKDLLDGVITIKKEEAFLHATEMAKKEGILIGISTGASLAAISKKIGELKNNTTIVTFGYDTGERYLSIEGLF